MQSEFAPPKTDAEEERASDSPLDHVEDAKAGEGDAYVVPELEASSQHPVRPVAVLKSKMLSL